MSPSPRNRQTAILISFLIDLGFQARLEDGQWVAQRTSGMMTRSVVLPDDPVVEKELVISAFWRQGAEMTSELEDALGELAEQVGNIQASGPDA